MEIDRNLNPNDNVNIELDDGDNRDIHVNSIRFLPPNYPLVGKIPIFFLKLKPFKFLQLPSAPSYAGAMDILIFYFQPVPNGLLSCDWLKLNTVISLAKKSVEARNFQPNSACCTLKSWKELKRPRF